MAKTSLGAAARKTVDTIHPIEAAPTSDPGPTPAPAPAPAPAPQRQRSKPAAAAPKWEDVNRRTNVWMPVGLPERIRDELVNRGDTRTMSALVVDLLNDWAAPTLTD
jgi:hypothetical protein